MAANQLIHESSPYLLQHAHNPVDWLPWGPPAIDRAKKENKPILVSIGYAACHWCHVMERESFEDENVAAFMNQHFVNIKIDREERPDLDHIYMDAVQAMTGSGGWPLNCFLTPEGKPFYGGTYFPPRRLYNRASWMEVLEGVAHAFSHRRHEIDAQAENLTAHLLQSNAIGSPAGPADTARVPEELPAIAQNLLSSADTEWGGFGSAPKFPQTASIRFLLQHYHITGNEASVRQALLSLNKMIQGGIYDQIGGGFARYATDGQWLVPHFEKMLYDNALLVDVLSEAYQLTGEERYRKAIRETIDFAERELKDPLGGFYSALDADSEGEEGRYYVWTRQEVERLLGQKADIFCEFYDITDKGNWEGKNILRVNTDRENFARNHHMSLAELENLLEGGRSTLLGARAGRTRPLLDDKILLGWNALMNQACSRAYMATGEERYRQLATRNMGFLLQHFRAGGADSPGFYHSWKAGNAKITAFLDDYAYLIRALIQLQAITGNLAYLRQARELSFFVLENFSEEGTALLCYTPLNQADVIVRKKEIYDGATPSGNAVMAANLHHLAILCGEASWRERAEAMVAAVSGMVRRYPNSFAVWACLLQELTAGTREVAVVGPEASAILPRLLALYLPHSVMIWSKKGEREFPLLDGKGEAEHTWIYLCHDFSCQQPVDSIERFISLINRSEMQN